MMHEPVLSTELACVRDREGLILKDSRTLRADIVWVVIHLGFVHFILPRALLTFLTGLQDRHVHRAMDLLRGLARVLVHVFRHGLVHCFLHYRLCRTRSQQGHFLL